MPCPFPGMDPWLESPDLWPGVHTQLIAVLRELLVPELRPRYVVDVERRVYLLSEDDPAEHLRRFVPDVAVIEGRAQGRAARPSRRALGAAAYAVPEPAIVLLAEDDVEVREPRLVIRTREGRALVTVIEVLSPANKTVGSKGRDEYVAKRKELLRSETHLVEIDLLRGGARMPLDRAAQRRDYQVLVSRSGMRPRAELFGWGLRDAVPPIAIPLLRGDADAKLDLARALGEVYDRGGYDALASYAAPVDPPLRPRDRAWAKRLLSRAGLP